MINAKVTLVDMAKEAHTTPQETWRVIAGGTTDNKALAKVLSKYSGVRVETFMELPRGRVRSGWVKWLGEAIGVAPNHAWRIVQGRQVKHVTAEKLEAFTGIPAMHWVAPEAYGNWLMEITREVTGKEEVEEAV